MTKKELIKLCESRGINCSVASSPFHRYVHFIEYPGGRRSAFGSPAYNGDIWAGKLRGIYDLEEGKWIDA